MAQSKSTTFSPSQLSAKCETFDDGKTELSREEKIDSTETLPQMVNKLCIDEKTSCDATGELVQKAATREEITVHDSKRTSVPSYDIDGMSFQDLQVSLRRIKESPQQPFSFLASVYEIFNDESQPATEKPEPTEIDMQLAAVAKRIESSRVLLEEAKSRVDEIRLSVKRDTAMLSQSSNTHAQNADKPEQEKQP